MTRQKALKALAQVEQLAPADTKRYIEEAEEKAGPTYWDQISTLTDLFTDLKLYLKALQIGAPNAD